ENRSRQDAPTPAPRRLLEWENHTCAGITSSVLRMTQYGPERSCSRILDRFAGHMNQISRKPVIMRDLESFADLQQVQAVEKEVWGLADRDVTPMTLVIATKAAG